MTLPSHSDVCVIGAGPAGLSAAIALAQSGFGATVIERALPPLDKVCGEGLLPDNISALEQLGIRIPAACGFRFSAVRFEDRWSSVTAQFPHGAGIGLRRTVLHKLLMRRAEQLGVSCVWGAKQVHLENGGVSAGEQFVRCRFVVAADGQNSGLRREAGLNRVIGERRRYGFRRHYRVLPWSRDMELYWGPRGQIYVTPVSADEVCVALLTRYRALRLDEALNDFPELRARVAGAAHASREQGALTVSRSLARVCRNDLALVGDASGSIDAVTGEGICLSFRQSLALAAALRSGNLKDYEAEHHSLSKRPRIMARLMLTLDDHVSLQRRALAGLAEQRDIFASLLAIHVGAASFADLISSRLFGFCRKFLVA